MFGRFSGGLDEKTLNSLPTSALERNSIVTMRISDKNTAKEMDYRTLKLDGLLADD